MIATQTELPEAARRFFRRALHDLAAPARHAGSFAGFAVEAIDAQPPDLAEARQTLSTVVTAATQMQRICRGLSTYLQLGNAAIEEQPVLMAWLVKRCWNETIRAKGVDAVRGDGELKIRGDATWLADTQSLAVAVEALIQNAIRYTAVDQPVHLDVEIRGSRIELTDRGIGIDPKYLTRVLEPFERLGPAADGTVGAGLGLAIAVGAAARTGVTIDLRCGEEANGGVTAIVEIAADRVS